MHTVFTEKKSFLHGTLCGIMYTIHIQRVKMEQGTVFMFFRTHVMYRKKPEALFPILTIYLGTNKKSLEIGLKKCKT